VTAKPGKLIYLARRNPRLTREQFMGRWRQHCALAMSLPRWEAIEHCAYCDVLPPIRGLEFASWKYDGIGVIRFRDGSPASPEDLARLKADEMETFSAHVDSFSLLVEENVVKAGSGTVKATAFFRRASPISRDDGDAGRLSEHPTAARLRRYVGNMTLSAGLRGNSTLDFAEVGEYWFDTVDDLRGMFTSPGIREAFGDGNLLVVTNEVVMYDRAIAS